MAVTWPHPTYTDGVVIHDTDLNIIRDNLNNLHQSGTYSPTLQGGTTGGTTTYTTQEGEWIRLGSVIHVWGRLVWTAVTGTGSARILLPVANANLARATGSLFMDSVTFTTTSPEMIIIAGNSYFEMYSPASNAASNILNIEAAGTLVWEATYKV
jgi:hypothetical protein